MRRGGGCVCATIVALAWAWPVPAWAQSGPTIAVEPAVALAGDAVEVRGEGWDNDCAVVLTLDEDDGALLGVAGHDDGVFVEPVTVPADTAAGPHHVVATGRLFGDVDTAGGDCGEPSGTRATAALDIRPSEDDTATGDDGAREESDGTGEGPDDAGETEDAGEIEDAGETEDAGAGVIDTEPRDAPGLWPLAAVLGLAAVGAGTVAHGRSPRWVRGHVRFEPDADRPSAALDLGRGPSPAIRLEPRAGTRTQTIHEVR